MTEKNNNTEFIGTKLYIFNLIKNNRPNMKRVSQNIQCFGYKYRIFIHYQIRIIKFIKTERASMVQY